MGLNLDAIKAKLNQLNRNDDRRNNLWKPEAGKTRVRIVPYVHRKDNPFLELYFHYDLAKRSMLSPVSFGNADPVVEFAEKLKKTGDKDEWLMGRKIEPKMRTPAEGGGYPKTAIRVKPNTSTATDDKAIAEKIMNQPTITDIFPEPTYEELENALKEWMNPEDDSSDVETTTATTTDTTTKTESGTAAKSEEKQTDVASAFNDLFNK